MCRLNFDNATDTTTGVAIGAPSSWMSFPTTERPWYKKSKSTGKGIWTDPYIFAGTELGSQLLGITAALPIYDSRGRLVAVAGADYLLDTLDTTLQTHVGTDGNFVLFIVDDDGYMIASSIEGTTYNPSTNVRLSAASVPNAIIATAANTIVSETNGFANANGTLLTMNVPGDETEIYWVQAKELQDERGLRWHVVVVERMQCTYGFYLDPEKSSCLSCPEGAYCPGSDVVPVPRNGYWSDRDSIRYVASVYECFRAGACKGGNKHSSCWLAQSYVVDERDDECESADVLCTLNVTHLLLPFLDILCGKALFFFSCLFSNSFCVLSIYILRRNR